MGPNLKLWASFGPHPHPKRDPPDLWSMSLDSNWPPCSYRPMTMTNDNDHLEWPLTFVNTCLSSVSTSFAAFFIFHHSVYFWWLSLQSQSHLFNFHGPIVYLSSLLYLKNNLVNRWVREERHFLPMAHFASCFRSCYFFSGASYPFLHFNCCDGMNFCVEKISRTFLKGNILYLRTIRQQPNEICMCPGCITW